MHTSQILGFTLDLRLTYYKQIDNTQLKHKKDNIQSPFFDQAEQTQGDIALNTQGRNKINTNTPPLYAHILHPVQILQITTNCNKHDTMLHT